MLDTQLPLFLLDSQIKLFHENFRLQVNTLGKEQYGYPDDVNIYNFYPFLKIIHDNETKNNKNSGLTLTKIRDVTDTTQQSIGKHIKVMFELGLIEKIKGSKDSGLEKDDRRCNNIILTDKGRALFDVFAQINQQLLKTYLPTSDDYMLINKMNDVFSTFYNVSTLEAPKTLQTTGSK